MFKNDVTGRRRGRKVDQNPQILVTGGRDVDQNVTILAPKKVFYVFVETYFD